MISSADVQGLARALREEIAGANLSSGAAKLYSQYTRLRHGQPGLISWTRTDARRRLLDAARLIDAALVERESEPNGAGWRQSMRRAAELLEWLSHPGVESDDVPTGMLSAASYQLAGYPARSASLLASADDDHTDESPIVRAFLRADFGLLLDEIAGYWELYGPRILETESRSLTNGQSYAEDFFANDLIDETVASLGVLCYALRWGSERRIETALDKLSALGTLMVHSEDPYSALLAKLSSEVARLYLTTSIRGQAQRLARPMSSEGREVLERYVRSCYRSGKALMWPSQMRGLQGIEEGGSFALCTPTGSGKTTIAELSIITELFSPDTQHSNADGDQDSYPIAMYLVPSRALAAEVESKLSAVLGRAAENRLTVTGLYGGTDWGPTDAWLTAPDRAVIVCTYEKGEALFRFLGPLFLRRLRLLVVDEAHLVEFQGASDLRWSENRALRLEWLMARLMSQLEGQDARVIALSAAAAGFENCVAEWVSGAREAKAISPPYRSTRQLIGRLVCLRSGHFRTEYDLLDGSILRLSEHDSPEAPFVPDPIPPCPQALTVSVGGSEKKLRPYVLWAAMHLAAAGTGPAKKGVLVSVPQQIGPYLQDFLEILRMLPLVAPQPAFFVEPVSGSQKDLWQRCLRSCADYFGDDSYEYQLLQRGIAVHHGKMPGLLARLLVEVIEARIVNIVLATSTLSEGVNLPFETVLVPSLFRIGRSGFQALSAPEFMNVVGRAGRPGYGTEGTALVMLLDPSLADDRKQEFAIQQSWRAYFGLVGEIQSRVNEELALTASPLAELLRNIHTQWRERLGGDSHEEFAAWLEQFNPASHAAEGPKQRELYGAVDTLDSLLLSALVEAEIVAEKALSPVELEQRLGEIWARSFARVVASEEGRLESFFLRRGKAVLSANPNGERRRRLYRTGLPLTDGERLLELYPQIFRHLASGGDYVERDANGRLDFVSKAVGLIGDIPQFALRDRAGTAKVDWKQVLAWWLRPGSATSSPSPKQVSAWHGYINTNFVYRSNWGVGSVVALALDEKFGGRLEPITLAEWPAIGLPWVVLWMKELITWGTLEPVAAFLLAHRVTYTRSEAEQLAMRYYESSGDQFDDALLNPTLVHAWVDGLRSDRAQAERSSRIVSLRAEPLRDFGSFPAGEFRVVPVERDGFINWIDVAGFSLARSEKPREWLKQSLQDRDFTFNVASGSVLVSDYFI